MKHKQKHSRAVLNEFDDESGFLPSEEMQKENAIANMEEVGLFSESVIQETPDLAPELVGTAPPKTETVYRACDPVYLPKEKFQPFFCDLEKKYAHLFDGQVGDSAYSLCKDLIDGVLDVTMRTGLNRLVERNTSEINALRADMDNVIGTTSQACGLLDTLTERVDNLTQLINKLSTTTQHVPSQLKTIKRVIMDTFAAYHIDETTFGGYEAMEQVVLKIASNPKVTDMVSAELITSSFIENLTEETSEPDQE